MVADCNTTWNLMPIITSAWESLSPTNVQLDESGGRHRRRRIVGGGRTYLCNWRSQCYFVLDFLEQWQRWWWTDWCMPAWDGRRLSRQGGSSLTQSASWVSCCCCGGVGRWKRRPRRVGARVRWEWMWYGTIEEISKSFKPKNDLEQMR